MCNVPLIAECIFVYIQFTVLEMDGVDLQLQLYDKDSASKDDVIGR